MGLPSFRSNTAGLPNHSQDRSTVLVIKIITLKRHDHSDSKKSTVKQARQDPYDHFHSKEIYMFYSEKSFHSEYISLNIYLITSNKSNTEFNYTPVFIFFKKILMILIWSLYPAATSNYTSELQRYVLSGTSHWKARPYCSYHCPEAPEEAPKSFFTKIKVLLLKDLLLSAWNTPPKKPD